MVALASVGIGQLLEKEAAGEVIYPNGKEIDWQYEDEIEKDGNEVILLEYNDIE